MDKLQLILTIAIPIYSLIVILLGVWLGHKLTMKAFSHVQPSTKDIVAAQQQVSVTNEPDWYDESQKDKPERPDDEQMESLTEKFEKTGLPMEIFDSYYKSDRNPQEFFGYDVPYGKQSVEEDIERES